MLSRTDKQRDQNADEDCPNNDAQYNVQQVVFWLPSRQIILLIVSIITVHPLTQTEAECR